MIFSTRIIAKRITTEQKLLTMVLLPLSVVLLLFGQFSYAGQMKTSHSQQVQQDFAKGLGSEIIVPANQAVADYRQDNLVKIKTYHLAQNGNQITMREAIVRAKRQFPGKVLSAKRGINRQGKVVYRIKLISNANEIRTIRIAANG